MGETTEPKVVEFDGCRVIGLQYAGKNEHGEIPALWGGETGFVARMGEVQSPPEAKYGDTGRHPVFGICRCLPERTDGAFEYVAGVVASADAPIPDGMIETRLSAGTHLAFSVQGLEQLSAVWGQAHTWLSEHPKWVGYCTGLKECDCANHPSFELYPPDFGIDGLMFIYLPVRAEGVGTPRQPLSS